MGVQLPPRWVILSATPINLHSRVNSTRNNAFFRFDMTTMKHFALILLAALTWSVSAQIELTQDLAPEALVEGVLEGEGVDAFNVSYSGSLSQIAVMGNGSSLGIPLDDAVIISTGHALAAECDAYGLEDGLGQVNDDLLEVANSVPGLIGSFNVSSVNDVASLEFDFIPADDQFGFAFVTLQKSMAFMTWPSMMSSPFSLMDQASASLREML